jgi:hypothetical protein
MVNPFTMNERRASTALRRHAQKVACGSLGRHQPNVPIARAASEVCIGTLLCDGCRRSRVRRWRRKPAAPSALPAVTAFKSFGSWARITFIDRT